MPYQILAILIWGSSFIAAKYSYEMLDAALMVEARLAVAALIMLPAALRYGRTLPKSAWKPLAWLAFLNFVVVLMLQFVGVAHTSAASAVTIVGLEPLMMVFVGHFFFGDKARGYHWLCGAAAFLGVAMLIGGGAEEGGDVGLFGCLLVLVAGLVFCFAMRPTQKLIGEIGASAYTSLALLLSALMCLPFSLVLADNLDIKWSIGGTASLLYLGIACSWFAYWLWNKGMSRVSANLSGLLIALEPVCGVLLAVLLLGEHVSPLSWAGIVLVIGATLCASVLPRWLDSKKAAEAV
ncbi:MAG: DMT family transporter [Neisseria sp.]|nr:DMT family transporter [Neisseria sp.]